MKKKADGKHASARMWRDVYQITMGAIKSDASKQYTNNPKRVKNAVQQVAEAFTSRPRVEVPEPHELCSLRHLTAFVKA